MASTSFFSVNNPSTRSNKVTTKVAKKKIDVVLAKISLKATIFAFFKLVSRFC